MSSKAVSSKTPSSNAGPTSAGPTSAPTVTGPPRVALYPGSFDPLTNGHLNIIRRALRLFDRLIVAVAVNDKKTPMFTTQERIDLIARAVGHEPGLEVVHFRGLLVEYARQMGAAAVVRGLRAVSDFEYEFQMAHMNHKLSPELETVFMMTGEEHFYVSSRLVKEVAQFGGDVADLVPTVVHEALMARISASK